MRELQEEVGLDITNKVEKKEVNEVEELSGMRLLFIGTTTIETSYNHCLVDCFILIYSLEAEKSVRFADGEVTWGKWMNFKGEFVDFLQKNVNDFVPDGMQVWNAFPFSESISRFTT